jgi:phage terminase small subunit
MAHKGRRGRKAADELLALELAKGRTVVDAAIAAGVSEKTARRRLVDLGFQARVSELRQKMVTSALGKLTATLGAAVDGLGGLLKAESESVRLGASKAVVELTTRLRQAEEIDRRLAELESQLQLGAQSRPANEGQGTTTMLLARLRSLPPLGSDSRN